MANNSPAMTCLTCGAIIPVWQPAWRCPCGGYFELRVQNIFSPKSLKNRPRNLWRYREALGITNDVNITSLGEGCTPLAVGRFDGIPVRLKLDFLCPTGSFKDRGSSVMISKLKEWNILEIVEDSSGNAGASVAAYASAAGISACIFVPDSTAAAKAAQIAMYGARLIRIPGTREETERQALIASKATFYASHNWNPYFLAGMKTTAYEISEELSWRVPEWVVAPVGGGGLIVGLYLGFRELLEHGITSRLPRLAAVQSIHCAPVYEAWKRGTETIPEVDKEDTAAEGIAIAKPVRGRSILEAIRQSAGASCVVSDDQMWRALAVLAKNGIYVEPTAAVAMAGLSQLQVEGHVNSDDCIVVVLTGSGLKATDTIVRHYFSE